MAAEEEWRRPRASVAQARPLAHEVFGFSAAADPSAAQQLVSYDDQNVLLQGQDAQGSHCRVVLKIHNRASLACLDQLEAQNEAMLLIQRAGIPCSNPVRCCDAAVARGGCSAHVAVRPLPPAAQDAQAELQHSEEFPVRMLTYIPGDLLRDVPLTPHLQRDLGRFMGRVSRALSGWDPPALRHLTHAWRLDDAGHTLQRLLPSAAQLLDAGKMSQLESFLAEWQQDQALQALLATLPRQVCHGDANEANLVVRRCASEAPAPSSPSAPASTSPEAPPLQPQQQPAAPAQGVGAACLHEVAGLLDFGDLCVSWAASEAAITMLYALLLSMEQAAAAAGEREAAAAGEQQAAAAGHSAPAAATSALHAALEVGRRVLAGFGEERPLSTQERQALPWLVTCRLALSLAHGAAAAVRDPGNSAYVLITQRHGWALFGCLREHGPGRLARLLSGGGEGCS